MSLYRRVIALCTCLLLLAAVFSALAEETDPVMTAEEAEAAGIEVEGIATEDEDETAVADAEDQLKDAQRQISAGVRPRAEFLMRMHSWNQA